MPSPSHLKYTAEHEWLEVSDGIATVGITEFAADALGDVVYLQLPSVGATLQQGSICGEIESTKSVSDLYAPADGTVTEINTQASEEPGVLNLDPYQGGWLFRMRVDRVPDLFDADQYDALTSGG